MRLVKTIGDAAMLVSPEPPALVEAALSLVDAAEAEGEDFPHLHAGVALGPVVSRGGDWYGHTVNLASRIADIARPSSVVCEDAVHEAAPEAFRLVVRRRAPPEGGQAAGTVVARPPARPGGRVNRYLNR